MVRCEGEAVIDIEPEDNLLQALRREIEDDLLEATICTHDILLVVIACIENKDATLLYGVGVVVAVEILGTRQNITYGYSGEREGAYSRIFAFCNLHNVGDRCRR